jgi:hypothetical protein
MRNVKITILLTALLLFLGLLLNACKPQTNEIAPPVGALLGTNGLSAPERQKFYHLPEGSELYPYRR